MISTQFVGEDMVIRLETVTLVSSKSQPGRWYEIGPDHTCECTGFAYRRTCRHVAAARTARQPLQGVALQHPGPEPVRGFAR